MCLQRRVLGALARKGLVVDDVRLGEASLEIADGAVDFTDDIAPGLCDSAGLRVLVVQDRRAFCNGGLGIEDGWEKFVRDDEPSHGLIGGCLALRDDSRDALPDEAHDIVENARIVGIGFGPFVLRGGEQQVRRILVRQYGDDAGGRQRRALVDGQDARVRMWRAGELGRGRGCLWRGPACSVRGR